MTLIGLALVSTFAGLACWLAYQLLRQQGRMLIRLDALERIVDGLMSSADSTGRRPQDGRPDRSLSKSRLKRNGLSRGTPAPDFRVPRVTGGELSLSEFRGQSLLLVFSDPNCAPCDALAPELERRFRSGDAAVVMVSRGELSSNLAKVARYGLTFPVGLQRQWEISRDYAMFATPIGYWIDEEGIVAAPVAVGADEILALLSQTDARRDNRSDALHASVS